MDIIGYPWILWISMDSMDIHGYPWISMDAIDIHGYSWRAVYLKLFLNHLTPRGLVGFFERQLDSNLCGMCAANNALQSPKVTLESLCVAVEDVARVEEGILQGSSLVLEGLADQTGNVDVQLIQASLDVAGFDLHEEASIEGIEACILHRSGHWVAFRKLSPGVWLYLCSRQNRPERLSHAMALELIASWTSPRVFAIQPKVLGESLPTASVEDVVEPAWQSVRPLSFFSGGVESIRSKLCASTSAKPTSTSGSTEVEMSLLTLPRATGLNQEDFARLAFGESAATFDQLCLREAIASSYDWLFDRITNWL